MRVTENSVILIEQSEKSVIYIDRAARPMWMTEFSVTYMFWSCVTLGFFNSVGTGCTLLHAFVTSVRTLSLIRIMLSIVNVVFTDANADENTSLHPT
jgi:hypothetical protein